MNLLNPITYNDIDSLDEETLKFFEDAPMDLIAACAFKMKFKEMKEATMTPLYADVNETESDLGDPIGYKLEVKLKSGPVLTAQRDFSGGDLKDKIKVQYKLAEDILAQLP